MIYYKKTASGFSLIEMALVVSLIGIFSTIAYSSYSDARAQSRDKARVASLQQLQLALELYKDKYGRYPDKGCGETATWVGPGTHAGTGWGNEDDCPEYIDNLVPEFMAALPRDPKDEMENSKGFMYAVAADGSAYKVLILGTIESALVTSYSHEFARCPGNLGANCVLAGQGNVYAIYSAGAENW